MTSWRNWLRVAGLLLFMFLFWKVDISRVSQVLTGVHPLVLTAAILLNVPQIFLKAYRWRRLLKAHGIQYGLIPSALSYFGSIFIGLLTPGRLGEFVKTVHVSRDCNVPAARAFSSVLVDRLFDLYALLLFGCAALISTAHSGNTILIFVEAFLLLIIPLILLLHNRAFEKMREWFGRGKFGQKMLGEGSWLVELRTFLKSLSMNSILVALLLTASAYAVFFGQCYLLAHGIDLRAGFLTVSFSVALGSLVTLIPVSVSGLGTREAAMIAYLGSVGVLPAKSLAYSLLIFITFYVAGALMGAAAWLIKPAPLDEIRKTRSSE